MKKIIIIAGIIVFALVCVVVVLRFSGDEDSWICNDGTWIKHGNPSEEVPVEKCPKNYDENSNIFTLDTIVKEGNLVRNNPGFEKDAWYLIYDNPGAPAVYAQLKFGDTRCEISETKQSCDIKNIQNGERVRVTGKMASGSIFVSFLELLK